MGKNKKAWIIKTATLIFIVINVSCATRYTRNTGTLNVTQLLKEAGEQYLFLKDQLKDNAGFPKTFDKTKQQFETSNSKWWCSGFYPGTLLYLYEATGEKALLNEANRMLTLLEQEQYNTETHDIGFLMYCSFGNANRLAPDDRYRQILIKSAKSLATRFNPKVGCIKSHNRGPNDFVVIIDNMMNLELLFNATHLTGDSSYYHTAVAHANTTLKNHFRPDFSSYHALNYNPETGSVRNYQAGQGYSERSAWARGQAWALYGYTLMYRETHDQKYLNQARSIAHYLLNHPNMPNDLVPYWDYNAPNIPNALRDASSTAIMSSALLELSRYVDQAQLKLFMNSAKKMLCTLSKSPYRSTKGQNGGFILDHSVGNIPAKKEVDAPLTYADYYYVEALMRYKKLYERCRPLN
jgi:rhamnogalacturonyl hydrolase YesR